MSTLSVSTITDASGGNTATINSYTPTESNMAGRNRIINGDMRIDQRNAGASKNIYPTSYTLFAVDRFVYNTGTAYDNTGTSQQVTTAPPGFSNSLKVTVTSTVSPSASVLNSIEHRLEGYSVADLGFGTADAKTVTVSFWVNCSVTGNFGGALLNSDRNRTYPFTYTVSSANTWEQKTVTIPGDTSGTWTTTNSRAMILVFGLSVGSTYGNGTAGAWSGTYSIVPSGSTNLFATNGATWYITGVQLEAGSVATPFEHRMYGQELALCQRYYCKTFNTATAPAQNAGSVGAIAFISQANQLWDAMWRFPVEMRTTPATVITYSTNQANANWSLNADSPTASTNAVGATGLVIRASTPAAGGRAYNIHASASAEL
jgi:hypothetical protein